MTTDAFRERCLLWKSCPKMPMPVPKMRIGAIRWRCRMGRFLATRLARGPRPLPIVTTATKLSPTATKPFIYVSDEVHVAD